MKNFMKKFTQFLDPKLEKYRDKEPEEEPVAPPPRPPESLEELVDLLRRTPAKILSGKDRALIASSMGFKDRKVSDIMMPRSEITFVYETDFLGPLMLDRLYKSGFSHFPVLSGDGRQIVGLIHTDSLNSLEIRDTDRAKNYLDKKVYYLRADYSLEQALAAFLRTNCFFFIVINKDGQLAGLLTYQMLTSALLGFVPKDNFTEDSSISAVMKR